MDFETTTSSGLDLALHSVELDLRTGELSLDPTFLIILRTGEFSLDPAFLIILPIAELNLRIGDGFLAFGIDSERFLAFESSDGLTAVSLLDPAIGFFSSAFLLREGLLSILAGIDNICDA